VDCELIDADLVGFHFAALDAEARARLEAHLPACGRCLAAYLAIKRLVDAGEEASERPSELMRARLRAAVGRELKARRAPRALVVGAAGVAAGVLLTLLARPLAQRDGTPERNPHRPAASAPLDDGHGTAIDSARPLPDNLNYL
jgi:hypothetical protein